MFVPYNVLGPPCGIDLLPFLNDLFQGIPCMNRLGTVRLYVGIHPCDQPLPSLSTLPEGPSNLPPPATFPSRTMACLDPLIYFVEKTNPVLGAGRSVSRVRLL